MSVARRTVSETEWRAAIATLAEGKRTLSALWAEADTVHMALLDESCGSLGVVSLPAAGGRYPSVGALHPPAIRPERALRDLTSLTPVGLPDERRWLNHGRWRDGDAISYEFLPAEGESLHQIAVGPVHAGIIEPGHFRFTANGETIVRLEARLGYVHKGIAALMTGAPLERAMQLAARASGDSTVAYQIAVARAVEDATDTAVPPRAAWLRALMGELERIANHLGDIGAICNDAAFPLLHAHTGVLRERVLRYSAGAFGHRLMMDTVVPGGVRRDLDRECLAELDRLIAEIRAAFPRIVEVYDNTASLQDRTVGTGTLKPELARQFGAGGYVGRASGRSFDARKALPYPPYDVLPVDVPVLDEGDVNARVWVRIREVEQSLTLLVAMRHQLPSGPLQAEIGAAAGEGMALIEGFRGDVFAFVRMNADGTVAHSHLRDPSQFQWPLLEAAIEGNIVADFPLCNKSFNCSYAGHDM
ncbi:MAG TPA: hydrogenase expression protein HypE [Bauldia sp.]|nr:hydrogenase expression protein HypE [Bauldia sp.]